MVYIIIITRGTICRIKNVLIYRFTHDNAVTKRGIEEGPGTRERTQGDTGYYIPDHTIR